MERIANLLGTSCALNNTRSCDVCLSSMVRGRLVESAFLKRCLKALLLVLLGIWDLTLVPK